MKEKKPELNCSLWLEKRKKKKRKREEAEEEMKKRSWRVCYYF